MPFRVHRRRDEAVMNTLNGWSRTEVLDERRNTTAYITRTRLRFTTFNPSTQELLDDLTAGQETLIVLRFRDIGLRLNETIREHRRSIGQHGASWGVGCRGL